MIWLVGVKLNEIHFEKFNFTYMQSIWSANAGQF